jgi:hypothetical protein
MKASAMLKELDEKATKGPWEEREDQDYEQGGTYLGTGRYHYSGRDNWGYPRKTPGPSPLGIGEDYFENNVCRIEGSEDDQRLISALRNALPALVALVEAVEDNGTCCSGDMVAALAALRRAMGGE